jgi:hypothetical protein
VVQAVAIVHWFVVLKNALEVVEFPTLVYFERFEGSAAMKDSYYCSTKPIPSDSKN